MVNASFISRLPRAVDLIAQRGQALTPKVVKVRRDFEVDHPDAARDGYAARVISKPSLLGRGGVFLALLAAVLVACQFPALAQADAWTLLREPGHVVLMRHAATSGGSGDPPSYRLDDCARLMGRYGRRQLGHIWPGHSIDD